MRSSFLMLPLAVALVAGCAKEPAAPTVDPVAQKPAAAVNTVSRSHDESSYAEPDKVVIKDLALDLKVDFDTKQIGGTATYTLEWKDKAAKQLLLDTRELTIDGYTQPGASPNTHTPTQGGSNAVLAMEKAAHG